MTIKINPKVQFFYLSVLFYCVAIGMIKLAFLLHYYRVFAVKSQKLIVWTITAMIVWSLVLIFMAMFPCRPVEKFWKPTTPGHCLPSQQLYWFNAAGNIVTDVIIFALPIPVLWQLHMPRSQRISLIGIFCLGFL